MDIESGFFFISDITGYTKFLTQSELDHAKEILDAVFDSILEHVEAPLAVSKVEGDAIFCYVSDRRLRQPQSMLDAMEMTYFEFRRQLTLMDINTTCDCNACVNMSALDLKIFIHHGDYIIHEIAGGTELTGPDVILAHRLMKNTVKETTGLTGYGLLTQAAIDAIGVTDATADMVEHVEHYEDFGEITSYIADLRAAWTIEAKRGRKRLPPEDAAAQAKVFVPVPPTIAWAYATDGAVKKRLNRVDTHERTDADPGARVGIGASFHCAHELGDVDYVIVDIDAPHYYTNANQSGDLATLTTVEIHPAEGGAEFQILMGMADGGGGELRALLQDGVDLAAATFAEIIAADLEAGVISQDHMELTQAGKKKSMRPGVAAGRFADLR